MLINNIFIVISQITIFNGASLYSTFSIKTELINFGIYDKIKNNFFRNVTHGIWSSHFWIPGGYRLLSDYYHWHQVLPTYKQKTGA